MRAPAHCVRKLHLVFQIERETMQRVPLLTSSTESFRSGLTGYAQLEPPRKTSPQKATKVCNLPPVMLKMPALSQLVRCRGSSRVKCA